jgi:hypothetical protein
MMEINQIIYHDGSSLSSYQENKMNENIKVKGFRPVIVTLIVFVNIFGWLTTEGVWVYLHASGQIPPASGMENYFSRAYIGLVNGFTIADAIWSNLTLLLSIFGLWKMKDWGWITAMMANTIWFYSMTFTFVRDLTTGLTGFTVFFLFFMAFAMFSSIYLWKNRRLFWDKTDLVQDIITL